MCNLYNVTKGPSAILEFTRAMKNRAGNLEGGKVWPDYAAPIVRTGEDGERELVTARWGMPSPKFALEGKKTDKGVTNIRNVKSPHWRRWLGVEHRCVVPATEFAEPARKPDPETGRKGNHWFALDGDRPLFCFAGVWTNWTSVRKLKEGEVTADLYGFLTCEPNGVVAPIHPKAMPVILTAPDEIETWLTADWQDAAKLQRPLPDNMLIEVGEPESE